MSDKLSSGSIPNVEELLGIFQRATKKNNLQGIEAVRQAMVFNAKAAGMVEEARRLAVFADAV